MPIPSSTAPAPASGSKPPMSAAPPNRHLPPGAIRAAEPLVDSHAPARPVLLARVLADAQRQPHRDPEALAAAEERHVDRAAAGDAVRALQVERLVGAGFGVHQLQ